MMNEFYVNEIEINFKPKRKLEQLHPLHCEFDIVRFLRKIWINDIQYRERFYCIYLNRQLKILGYSLISIGGCYYCIADPKLILQPALKIHANSIILAHNHISNNQFPSKNDIDLTAQLSCLCYYLDISIHDHVILTYDAHFSFKSNNLI